MAPPHTRRFSEPDEHVQFRCDHARVGVDEFRHGFEISGQPSPEFGEINATYPAIFQTFSAPRLFSPLGTNVMDA